MIGRHWCGRAAAEDADGYLEHLRLSTLPQLERIAGHRGAYVLRRVEGNGVAFVVLTLWDSLGSVRAFGGEKYETAVVPPEARRLLSSFDDRAAHYEVAIGTTSGEGGQP